MVYPMVQPDEWLMGLTMRRLTYRHIAYVTCASHGTAPVKPRGLTMGHVHYMAHVISMCHGAARETAHETDHGLWNSP